MNRPITARTDAATAKSHWTMGRTDSERAYRAARRHSRLVRILRVAVPLAVVAGIAIVTLVTLANPLRMIAKLPVDIGDLVVSGTKITMEQPRLSGFTNDARAYHMTADAAAQDLTKPDIVELSNINAKVGMQDEGTMHLSAVTGVYNTKSEMLKLERDIHLSSSSGYTGLLSEATVDIRKGHVVSDQPVEVSMLNGKLNANRLEIKDSGDIVIFHGGVDMHLMLNGTALPPHLAAKPPQKKAAAQ